MSYYQLYYHIVTSTKNRVPLITEQVEPFLYQYVREKAMNLGASVYALNGVDDHIHLVVSIPPKIAVATFIGQVKAVASTRYNKVNPQQSPFFWQSEYGVFSFDRRRLPNYVEYVEKQKDHHRQGSVSRVLELCEDIGNQIAEEKGAYLF